MSKQKFTAIFSDGTEKTRASNHQYTHAWKVSSVKNPPEFGFSLTKINAEKTARSIASHRENFNGYGKCSIEVVEVQS